MKIPLRIFSILVTLSLLACGNSQQTEHVTESKNVDQGRPETKSIQAADAVGYDGTAIRSKLDAALDANDQRAVELGKEIDAQTDGSNTSEEPSE